MKHVFSIYSIILFFSNCCKEVPAIIIESRPLRGIEVNMVGKWRQYGDTTFYVSQTGKIDTVIHSALIYLNEDLTFSCKGDPRIMNKFDSLATGTWAHDTLEGYNTINIFMDIKNDKQVTFPDNSIYWVVYPALDTLTVSQHADIQLGYTDWSLRKFRKE
jgi:hypothetical protein